MIILLSGISCSGKSTLSKQLLRDFELPFVYHSFDFLVPSLLPHEDSFEAISMEGSRTFPRKVDLSLLQRINKADIDIIGATYCLLPILDKAGCNVIVDTILKDEVLDKILSLLDSESEVYLIGVHCSWDELERRVRKRLDRKIENVRNQYDSTFHKNKEYDLEVDTSNGDLAGCARKIIEFCGER